MGFGLFGKLPQKRDFIAYNIAGDVLAPIETWLQSAVAASRSELGRAWEELYLVAPIWRFWIGADVLGAACAGALMPSVDGVGRFFPLLAIYVCEEGETLPPPSYSPQQKWFAALEVRLLGVLDEGAAPAVAEVVADLPPPAFDRLAPNARRSDFKGGTVWQAGQDTDTPSFLAAIFEDDYRQVARGRSYWWVPGNEERGPVLHARNGLPDPYFHTRMLRVVTE
ncbi:type VI secretion system-associated protein TagF [Pseudaminobacter sp. 19-2017]|uniref:Type VI secretion system-associated protein TagF n=1 Tax=Pseudaminobacter soli (ex Zhang et al. 2022) TaxID=2831468 RepID=A0A942I9A3_9HYPH|nr:type VI secretion system-associated protein TagF [Pseudaminobacter soli]MBS3650135.1 type VI secretion system-associated protein TagF [Pseudaminobacter soli]